jgi:hypothetical protein
MSSGLKRLWRSVPLHRLKQGSTLSIKSHIEGAAALETRVVVQPEWRDDGHAELVQKQTLSSSDVNRHVADMIVKQNEKDVSITLQWRQPTAVSDELMIETTGQKQAEQYMDVILPHALPQQPVDRVILDDGTVRPLQEWQYDDSDFQRVNYSDGAAHIKQRDCSENESPTGVYLNVQVPEKVNLVCDLPHGGSCTVTGKVEGNVKLSTSEGDIRVTKLRGHTIDLQANSTGSAIYASTLLEAQRLTVRTKGRFRAKQVHGHVISVDVEHIESQRGDDAATTSGDDDGKGKMTPEEDEDDEGSLVDVSSLFVSGHGGATIKVEGNAPLSRRAVRIKSSHGPVNVKTKGLPKPIERNGVSGDLYPVVELGGVNGSCEVSIAKEEKSSTLVSSGDDEHWSSCSVHVDSLSPESVSLIQVDGSASLTLDRKAVTDLRLLTLPNSECLAEAAALIAEEENPELLQDVLCHLPPPSGEATFSKQVDEDASKRISINTKAFTPRPNNSFRSGDLQYVDGWMENKSSEPDSRFERKVRAGSSGSSGKIRLEGAADQALHSFSLSTKRKNETDATGSEDAIPASQNDDENEHPLLAVAATGSIGVETLSWLGIIARRYGFDEAEGKNDLGRTASRRGRRVDPVPAQ